MTTLRKGSTGAEVKELQRLLNLSGAGLTVDGDFGAKTHLALIKFQKENGLNRDGVCGPLTWEKLKAQTPNVIQTINECVDSIINTKAFKKLMEVIGNG